MEYSAPNEKQRGHFIQEYRKLRGYTQFELAEAVGVDERTIRMWERGEVISIRRGHIDNLISKLDMPRGLLAPHKLLLLEDAGRMEKDVPELLTKGAYVSAFNLCQQLLRILKNYPKGEDMLSRWVRAEYLMGNTAATVTGDPKVALQYYKRMERHAKQLEKIDPLASVLAHMNQAEMYRRLGLPRQAQGLLEDVEQQLLKMRHVGDGNLMLGNCYQWLARVYLAQDNESKTMYFLNKAHEQAIQISGQERPENAWYSCFCVLSVVEEMAKSYMILRQYPKSLEHVEQLKLLVKTAPPRWRLSVILREAEVNLRASLDIAVPSAKEMCYKRDRYDRGMALLLQGDKLAREHHHLRLQQRVDRFLMGCERAAGLCLEVVHTTREARARLIQPERE